MGFYFLATFLSLVIAFYISFLVDPHGNRNSFSGFLISLFFLAIMLPGFFLSPIIRRLRSNVNLISLAMICAGLLFIGLFKAHFWLIAGCTLVGLGYGIIQPIVYDKAAAAAPLHLRHYPGRDVGKLSGDRSLSVHYRPVAKHSGTCRENASLSS